MSQGYVSGGDWLGAITNLPFQALAYQQSVENQNYQRQQDLLNRQMQYDFAQNSIKWRVKDAKEAGIHPLAALGVSPSSASPVYSSSEAPRAPQFDFGELFKAQVDLVRSETAKNEAEASAIAGQDSSQGDVSRAGPTAAINPVKVGKNIASQSKKTNNAKVLSFTSGVTDSNVRANPFDESIEIFPPGIKTQKEMDEFTKEWAQDPNLGVSWKYKAYNSLPDKVKKEYTPDFGDSTGPTLKMIKKNKHNMTSTGRSIGKFSDWVLGIFGVEPYGF